MVTAASEQTRPPSNLLHTSTSCFCCYHFLLLATQQRSPPPHPRTTSFPSNRRHLPFPFAFPFPSFTSIPLLLGELWSMGKSKGAKWIRNMLFGKKSSKSGFSKLGTEKEPTIAFNTSPEISAPQSAVQSDDQHYAARKVEDNVETTMENITYVQSNVDSVVKSPTDTAREAEAASLVQATFRGYLARRAFRVLKGIIRLQALIRGHLVRRQAVSTLHCVRAVVNLQRMIRGQRSSATTISFKSEKLWKNSYVCKLIASSPPTMPLNLHYDPADPNCAENWLGRWSSSHFWEALPQARKVVGSKLQKQQNGVQRGEVEPARSKRTIRKSQTNAPDNGSISSSDVEKPIRGLRKNSGNKPDPVQEHAPNELERVKRNLRKVAAASKEASDGLEGEVERPKINPTETILPISDESVKDTGDFADVIHIQKALLSENDVQIVAESPAKSSPAVEMIDSVQENVEISPSREDQTAEEVPAVDEEQTPKDDNSGKGVLKTKRRMSVPAKQELSENVLVNTPNRPSYMAATESAKAKLKGHGSSRFSHDGAENSYVRRHSLPSSTNGKLNSASPQVQRQAQVNGKAGERAERLLSSKDSSEKPGWRR
ncbi:hypothetical protein MLD38_013172 [Melastoma candidum]|uniref:Uncharacterized protein n=1 Tax=Melastoma candidum TaxID=119954 RepID=A0ACB9R8U2_9MYRT|nr:hypothetical protein MLD38_013172 [Melastoma candidum]